MCHVGAVGKRGGRTPCSVQEGGSRDGTKGCFQAPSHSVCQHRLVAREQIAQLNWRRIWEPLGLPLRECLRALCLLRRLTDSGRLWPSHQGLPMSSSPPGHLDTCGVGREQFPSPRLHSPPPLPGFGWPLAGPQRNWFVVHACLQDSSTL